MLESGPKIGDVVMKTCSMSLGNDRQCSCDLYVTEQIQTEQSETEQTETSHSRSAWFHAHQVGGKIVRMLDNQQYVLEFEMQDNSKWRSPPLDLRLSLFFGQEWPNADMAAATGIQRPTEVIKEEDIVRIDGDPATDSPRSSSSTRSQTVGF